MDSQNIEYISTLRGVKNSMKSYLQASEIINCQHPTILELAKEIAARYETTEAIAKVCFEWVRD